MYTNTPRLAPFPEIAYNDSCELSIITANHIYFLLMSKLKKIFLILLPSLAILLLGIFLALNILNSPKKDKRPLKIITSNFVAYDFSRAILGEERDVMLLLKPGTEAHSFEPTPEDIISIKNSELFVYIGGESEEYLETLLENNKIPEEKTLRLIDFIELKTEDGGEEYDEHIWTSLRNSEKLVSIIKEKLIPLYPEREAELSKNASEYISRLEELDRKFSEVVASSEKNELVFADRFPFRYFTDDYNLKYFAAFPGCSEETEASAATIASLIEKVKENNLKVILKIELTSDKLAKTISNETGAKILELNSAHNISKEDFENKTTYFDLLEKNLAVIKEALE